MQLITVDAEKLEAIILDCIPWGGGEPLEEWEAIALAKKAVEKAIAESQARM